MSNPSDRRDELEVRIREQEAALVQRYGPLIHGADLIKVAGYPTAEALRLGVRRNAVGFPVFSIRGRRGRFAHATDVARWLCQLEQPDTQSKGGES